MRSKRGKFVRKYVACLANFQLVLSLLAVELTLNVRLEV